MNHFFALTLRKILMIYKISLNTKNKSNMKTKTYILAVTALSIFVVIASF